MKRFLYFSISVGILCTCGFSGLLLWKNHQTHLAAKEKRSSEDQFRASKDQFYDHELNTVCGILMNPESSFMSEIKANEWFESTLDNMRQDGYDRWEIEKMTRSAIDQQEDRKRKLNATQREG
jgi:cellobiose-specific phosphotransferase system component IIB